jgi:hypothetical protein
VLSNDLKQKYIDTLTNILDSKRLYKARAGIKRTDGRYRIEEITVIKYKCVKLRDFIINSKLLVIQKYAIVYQHEN